jgi:hypothetical protein
VYLAALAIVLMVIPRLGSRSPVAIALLCVLAVLTMKLVERRVYQWFHRWADRQAAPSTPPEGRP